MAPRSRHSTSKASAANAANSTSNNLAPDMTKLADMAPPPSPAILNGSANGNGVHADGGERERKEPEPGSGPGSFEQAVDLNAITHRQLSEDITAYRYDLSFTDDMLKDPNLSLTPQEIRLCQFRMLDLGHQIRHCQHRTEQIDAQIGNVERPSFYFDHAPKRRATGPPNGTPAPAAKRPRASAVGVENGDETLELDLADGTSIQRLGYWMCHLCTANKYLSAGQNRVPSAPCKWPLRDVSKMLTHFLDMHTEHDPEERCQELGNALAANRGPFEYWLTRTKHVKVRDSDVMDGCIDSLQAGAVPESLKKINRAASMFPNSLSMKEKPEESAAST